MSVANKPILLTVIMLSVLLLNVGAPHNDITLGGKCFYLLLGKCCYAECRWLNVVAPLKCHNILVIDGVP